MGKLGKEDARMKRHLGMDRLVTVWWKREQGPEPWAWKAALPGGKNPVQTELHLTTGSLLGG